MTLVTHRRGFALNFAGTRYTKSGSFIVGLQDGSRSPPRSLRMAGWLPTLLDHVRWRRVRIQRRQD